MFNIDEKKRIGISYFAFGSRKKTCVSVATIVSIWHEPWEIIYFIKHSNKST